MSNCKVQLAITMQSPRCKKDSIVPRYFTSRTKYIHCTKLMNQQEAWIAGWVFSSAGLGSCLLLLEAGAPSEERFSDRGASPLNLQGSDGLCGSYLRAAPGHPSACWGGLWLAEVSGPVRCPAEKWVCSRQWCSFNFPPASPLGSGAGRGLLDGGAAMWLPPPPSQAPSAIGHHPRTKGWSGLTPSEWYQNTLMIPNPENQSLSFQNCCTEQF